MAHPRFVHLDNEQSLIEYEMGQNKVTMRGWAHTSRGTPAAVLTLRTDLPKPMAADLRADEVIVKVSYVALDQGQSIIIQVLPHLRSKPWIPGLDFSGIVEAVGSNVTHVQPGDPVLGSPNPKSASNRYTGMLVEYAILPAAQVVRKPPNISLAAASTVATNGCTAFQFIRMVGMKKGDRVLITGASGGLGTLLVQVVRSVVGKEGTIVGSCSAANEQLVKNLGADEVVDYRAHPVLNEYLKTKYSTNPFDAILDIAGADDYLYDKCPAFLKPGGTYLIGGKMSITHGNGGLLDIVSFALKFYTKSYWPRFLGGVPRKGFFHSASVVGDDIVRTAECVEAGHLKGTIDREFAMEDALKAFEAVATGRARGKFLVNVQNSSD